MVLKQVLPVKLLIPDLSLNMKEFCAILTRFMLCSAIVCRRSLRAGYFSMTALKSARDSWKNSAASAVWPAYALEPSDLTVAVRFVSNTRAVSPKNPPTFFLSISCWAGRHVKDDKCEPRARRRAMPITSWQSTRNQRGLTCQIDRKMAAYSRVEQGHDNC